MVLHGQLELGEGGRRHRLEAGGPLLFLPAASWHCRSRAVNALLLGFEPALLASCLGEGCGSPPGIRAPRLLDAADPLQASLMASLSRLVPLLDLAALMTPAQLAALQLDALLHRLTALLLASEPPVPAAAGGDPHLAPLLRWIEAHLDRPLGLRDLERASGYSGRTLQYAFKRRFGCTPMRWLRQRRLERARDVLLRRTPVASMGQLAGQVGYGNPSAFSRDFRQTFGVSPSALLGRGRS
ncbi:MAG: AraC family transcriptional regulator [Synechococcaceae cyanobacterium]|nr:AraC family transcriptional regulator [Synechococcaceae cyanobacterium]